MLKKQTGKDAVLSGKPPQTPSPTHPMSFELKRKTTPKATVIDPNMQTGQRRR